MKSILRMSKKDVKIEKIKLINAGLLEDDSYHLKVMLDQFKKTMGLSDDELSFLYMDILESEDL